MNQKKALKNVLSPIHCLDKAEMERKIKELEKKPSNSGLEEQIRGERFRFSQIARPFKTTEENKLISQTPRQRTNITFSESTAVIISIYIQEMDELKRVVMDNSGRINNDNRKPEVHRKNK